MQILDKSDYEEPSCCLSRPKGCGNGQQGRHVRGEGETLQKLDTEAIIKELDRLLDRDLKEEAEAFLEERLSEARDIGDWSSEITIQNEIMGLSRHTQNREAGLRSVEEGLALLKEHEMEDTVTAGTTYVNAATTLKAFGQADKAMPYYEAAWRLYNRFLDAGDYRFAGLSNNMALTCMELRRYEEAERYFKAALAVTEKLPHGEMELAVTYTNMAVLYDKWQQSEEKINDCLNRAWAYFEDPKARRDAYYAFNCRKCASTFGYYGFFMAKLELTERADAIYAAYREETQ